jgi:mannose-6-phosphate isomerase
MAAALTATNAKQQIALSVGERLTARNFYVTTGANPRQRTPNPLAMSEACNYLLRFEPLFRRYLWGGRRLGDMLGKPIGAGDDYAESWEIVDHNADQSVVVNGALAGRTLGELVRSYRMEMLGANSQVAHFPLLLKFLDCNRTLSVQVHPNDDQAALLSPPDLGKTEAWVVLHANPGSRIYAGLRRGVTRASLAAAMEAGAIEDCLHAFDAHAGDCVFIPAGTVHALGAGLVIAEIQQASDTTFRLFDWNRLDAAGMPRPLHVTQSLGVIDFSRGPVDPQVPVQVGEGRERLVECDKFVLERRRLAEPTALGGDGRFHLIAVLEGAADVADATTPSIVAGETALLPAAAPALHLAPQAEAVILDIFSPG